MAERGAARAEGRLQVLSDQLTESRISDHPHVDATALDRYEGVGVGGGVVGGGGVGGGGGGGLYLEPTRGNSSNSSSSSSSSGGGSEFVKRAGYSVVLPEKLADGKWNVYRSARFPLHLVQLFVDTPSISSLHENFEHAERKFANEPALGTRVRPDGTLGKYEWRTYAEWGAARSAFGSGLIRYGVPKGAKVGLYFINREEWLIAEQGCFAYGMVPVPLYDTLGPDSVKYICNHADLTVVVCTRDKLQTVVECLDECPGVRLVVVIGPPDQVVPQPQLKNRCEIVSYSRLESQGRGSILPFSPPRSDDLATICYTSGTTGNPKGAMLTHANLVSGAAGICTAIEVYHGDVHISYLPLAHIYERANIHGMIHVGMAIGFYQGDPLKLLDDLIELKPTIFTSVPRLYNRIYDRIMATVKTSGGIKERLFHLAFNAKKRALAEGRTPSSIWDKVVFNKIKERIGGRVRIMVTGASPISPEVFDFLKVCFGGRLVEGYGMTETSCLISCTDDGDSTSGHVGSPSPSCEIKLVDVPEMQYTSADKPYPRGEICVRGPIVFQGYFKDKAQTAEMVDGEGWLHTGDIGMWLPRGRLKIIDRKKNIFKLAQGEYIAPEKIENVYIRSPFIAQCFIHGDSLNAYLVAIVVPDFEVLEQWAKSKGIGKAEDHAGLCGRKVVNDIVLTSMDEAAKEAKLRGFELAKRVYLSAEPFTVENGLLTPTLKIKRQQARAMFTKQIEDMYIEIGRTEASAVAAAGSRRQ